MTEIYTAHRLIEAAYNGSYSEVMDCLRHNININSTDIQGRTALHGATKEGHIKIMQRLLEQGADVDIIDCFNETALHIAARHDNIAAIDLLTRYKANPDIWNTEDHNPYEEALANQNTNAAKILKRYMRNEAPSTEKQDTDINILDIAQGLVNELITESNELKEKQQKLDYMMKGIDLFYSRLKAAVEEEKKT